MYRIFKFDLITPLPYNFKFVIREREVHETSSIFFIFFFSFIISFDLKKKLIRLHLLQNCHCYLQQANAALFIYIGSNAFEKSLDLCSPIRGEDRQSDIDCHRNLFRYPSTNGRPSHNLSVWRMEEMILKGWACQSNALIYMKKLFLEGPNIHLSRV